MILAIGILIGVLVTCTALLCLLLIRARRVVRRENDLCTRRALFTNLVSLELSRRMHNALARGEQFDPLLCYWSAFEVDPACLPNLPMWGAREFVYHVQDGKPEPEWLRWLPWEKKR